MRLFHGSNMRVERIDLSRSKRFKDFGQAFYLSDDESQAHDMAESRADFLGGEPVVYGPIMNDTIGFQMREFRKKHKDLSLFLEGIKYEKGETFQWAFCTEKAIKCLRRL